MQTEKQRERLVGLLKETFEYTRGTCIDFDEAAEINADYLMSNNVVVLPCKVGHTVYSFSTDFGVVLPYLVGTLNIGYMGKSGVYYSYEANCSDPETDELLDEIDFESEDIGKTVFLSREEAENALKERK
ncbi:MAG: hypothetical protein J6V20_01585 [Bacteroidaceae bacterium]|nr:hypothetical protein [Bacteroidaceae bacterium]